MSEFRSRTALTMTLAGVLALAACGKSAPPPASAPTPVPAAPAPAPAAATPAPAAVAPAPAPVPAFVVNSVVLGTAAADGKIATPTTTFTPKDTIYAVVTTTIANPNTAITARWTYQGGQLVREDAQTLTTAGANITTLHISKADGFPAGTYALDVLYDGKSVSTTPFSVK